MSAVSVILDIVLILISIVLIAAVLMQQGQRQGLGAISGGAETFFGKNKARGLDAKLAKITKMAAVAFIVLAIVTTIVVSHNGTSAAGVDEVTQSVLDSLENDAATVETTSEPAAESTDEVEGESVSEAVDEATEEPVEATATTAAE